MMFINLLYLPLYSGVLFSRNELTPSNLSSVLHRVLRANISRSSPTSWLDDMDACTTRFAMRMATGPFAISLEAIFLASAIRSVFGTHLVASPICTASGPPILRPKRITSWALPSPISLASLWVPPAPGKSPNPVSGSANNASSDTTRKSQAIAVSQPPPNAYPFTHWFGAFLDQIQCFLSCAA